MDVLLAGSLALKSQNHFWQVPSFKRAMTFVFFMRYLLGHESQRQWHRFSVRDLKFNTRCFKRWCDNEHDILSKNSYLKALPDDYECPMSLSQSKRARSSDQVSSDSPVKRQYKVGENTTDEEDWLCELYSPLSYYDSYKYNMTDTWSQIDVYVSRRQNSSNLRRFFA